MGRAPCCSKVGLHKGPWSTDEDKLLSGYIQANGEGHWKSLPERAGLLRCGKSCRLRWMNYLRPGIKRGNITADEEDLIIRLQSVMGNRWSHIAGRLPGRTDNEIKNHWNTHLLKRLKEEGIEPQKSQKILSKKTFKATKKKPRNHKADDRSSSDNHQQEASNNNTTKVHLPKPIKVCNKAEWTTSYSWGSVTTADSNSSSNQDQDVDQEAKPEVSHIPGSSFKLDDQLSYGQRRVETSDDNHILLDDDWDLSLQGGGGVPVKDNMLDMVYNEYLQLL